MDRNRKQYLSLIAIGLSLIPLFSSLAKYSWGTEKAILRVVVNKEDKGVYFLIVTPEGDILFSKEELKKIGLRKLPEGEGGYISLNSLSPGVSFEINKKEAALYLTVNPILLQKTSVDLNYMKPSYEIYKDKNSAFINYAIDYTAGNDFDFESLSVPWEMALRVDKYLGFSSFSYYKTEYEDKFVRQFTNFTVDDSVNLRRYILGDFVTFSGMLGSGGTIGGLSVSKNFSIDPYFVKYPGLNIAGELQTPSKLEFYVNDRLIDKEHLHSGGFEFLGTPGITGSGEARLVETDAYGQERITTIPFYISTNLLKPGLHDYSYNVGFERASIGQENFDYKDPVFSGFHRYGFSDDFTGGLRIGINEETVNLSPDAAFLLGTGGEIDTSVAFSLENGDPGFGAILRYLYKRRSMSGSLALSGFSRDYANVFLSASEDKPLFQGFVGLGLNLDEYGSISANYSYSDFYETADTRRAFVNYYKSLYNKCSLYVTVSRIDSEEVEYDFFVGLNFILGRNTSGNISYHMQDNEATATATIQQNPPLGTGFGYRLLARARDYDQNDRKVDGNGLFQYRGPYGIYSAGYSKYGDDNIYNLNTSGSVALIDNSLHFARPILDSFALVDVGDSEGVRVFFSNQEVGRTNSKGEVLVPDVISYYDNKFSIAENDIPVNYKIAELEKSLGTRFKSGAIVKFDIMKLQGFVGYLSFMEKGKKIPAEYAGLEIKVGDRMVETVVGKEGEVYLENISPGKFPARLYLGDKECNFDIVIPESDEAMVYMGEVVCEID